MLAPFFSNPAFKCVSRIICISDRRLPPTPICSGVTFNIGTAYLRAETTTLLTTVGLARKLIVFGWLAD